MQDRLGRERLLELLLAGTPDRVIAGLVAASPDDQKELVSLRQELAELACLAPPRPPPPALRERLLASKPKPRRPRRPVVVVLDMINEYLQPGGPLEVPRAREVVPAVRRLLDTAHRSSTPVIYVCDTHTADDEDFRDWPRHAVEGSAAADVWPEIAPSACDHVIRKRTYSAFYGSRFAELLDELHADELVLTGCATEVGLFATAMEALGRGFVVTVPPDCQAGASAVAEQVTLVTLSALVPFAPRYLHGGR